MFHTNKAITTVEEIITFSNRPCFYNLFTFEISGLLPRFCFMKYLPFNILFPVFSNGFMKIRTRSSAYIVVMSALPLS